MRRIILLLVLSSTTTYFTQQITSQQLVASDGTDGNWFGYSVELTDSMAFIGAPGAEVNGIKTGAVYVFKKSQSGWVEIQKITASNSTAGNDFGFSVSSDGEYLAIGGVATYIFKYENQVWNQIQLMNLEGISVSISGEYLIVGQNQVVSIFKLENGFWNFKQSIIGENNFDQFGYSVSLKDDKALIGANLNGNENGSGAGAAFLIKRVGEEWIQTRKIIAADSLARRFGYSVKLHDNKAIIGAIWDDTFTVLNGAAYIYNFYDDSLVIDQKVFAGDWHLDDRFGSAVSILGDVAVVGAFGVDLSWYEVGAAYIFKKENNNWFELQKLTPEEEIPDLEFGTSVAISTNHILIGGPLYIADPSTIGYAYIFSGITVSVDDDSPDPIPTDFSLEQNYPNPFNPSTKIKFTVPNVETRHASSLRMVSLKVYGILGNEIASLVNEELSPGEYEIIFDNHSGAVRNLTSGIYFYTLRAGGFVQTKKMLLLK